METIDIIVEDPRWHAAGITEQTSVATRATLAHLALDPAICAVSCLACDDRHIAQLNTEFRNKPTPTNVLSWPAEERASAQRGAPPSRPIPGPDGVIELGDIALSYDTCLAEASAANKPLSAHMTHLIIHGVLHLLGYDHIDDADAALMERLEVEILGKLGLDDPY